MGPTKGAIWAAVVTRVGLSLVGPWVLACRSWAEPRASTACCRLRLAARPETARAAARTLRAVPAQPALQTNSV